MQQSRTQLTALSERVQTLSLRKQKGLFVSLENSRAAVFKWQQPGRFSVDLSGIMEPAFRIGSDGGNWWLHSQQEPEYGGRTRFILCPPGEMHREDISLCDPFGLTRRNPAAAAADLKLRYIGATRLDSAEVYLIETWRSEAVLPDSAPFCDLYQWWIDARTLRPVRIDRFDSVGNVTRRRYFYDSVNQPLSPEEFAVPNLKGISPAPPDALSADYTNRYVEVHDGSRGRIGVWWGISGPGGERNCGMSW